MKNMAQRADELVARLPDRSTLSEWDRLRDWVDGQTGGDLDCVELDLLTDCVSDRVKRDGR